MPKRDRSAMERAHDEIARLILDLELAPGATIDDARIAAQLQLSRTPVREALFRLSSDGLVGVGPRGGFQVAPLDLLGVRSMFEAQQLLVRGVARLLAARASEADLDQLEAQANSIEDAVDRGDPSVIARENTALHILEARLTGNSYLEGLASRIHRENQRLAFLSLGGGGSDAGDAADHHRVICAQHRDILDALRARDGDRAEKLAAEHVELFRQRIVALLEPGPVDHAVLGDIAVE